MKKALLGLSLVLSIVALILSGFASYKMDKLVSPEGDKSAYVDSLVLESVQNTVNPLFSSVEEVLTFRDLSVEGEAIDNEFNAMPEELLKTVAGTLIKREQFASKRSIVYEYRANRQVYDNLPSADNKPNGPDAITGESSSTEGNSVRKDSVGPQNEVRYNQHDTVVGGKTYKVRTKTETTYE